MRVEKTQLVDTVSQWIDNSAYFFFIAYKGINVSEFTDLRNQLHDVDTSCHVLKNTTLRFALKNSVVSIPEESVLLGNTAVIFGSHDITGTAKIVKSFTSEKVSFKGVLIDKIFADAEQAVELAELPPKEALYSQILTLLERPSVDFVSTLNAHLASIVFILHAYSEKIDGLNKTKSRMEIKNDRRD